MSIGRLKEIWRAYSGSGRPVQVYAAVRYLLCPFDAIVREAPRVGSILDVGCGAGVLLYILSRLPDGGARKLVGIDVDGKKISAASALPPGGLEFHHRDVSEIESESFDCVTVVDILYLLPMSRWPEFLGHCVRVLRKGGLLVIKEVADRPRWKHLIAKAHELLTIYVIGMTMGNHPHFESIETYIANLESAKTKVIRAERVDAMRPAAHVLFLARKP